MKFTTKIKLQIKKHGNILWIIFICKKLKMKGKKFNNKQNIKNNNY